LKNKYFQKNLYISRVVRVRKITGPGLIPVSKNAGDEKSPESGQPWVCPSNIYASISLLFNEFTG